MFVKSQAHQFCKVKYGQKEFMGIFLKHIEIGLAQGT
jgi:hypothetical protein